MLYCHHTILRICGRIGFIAFTGRIVATVALALLLPVFASGYTVVLRDGRWIEIPDRFQVTERSLTYEVKPGLLVTLQLTSIDIAATDVANGSPDGTLLRRVGQDFELKSRSAENRLTRHATRTMTNQDLEETRIKRIKSEAAYEVRRKELGLPSREETDSRRQEESARAREILARSEVEQAESESYWRARATSLRDEIFVLDSEIGYVRARLSELSGSNSVGSFVTYGGQFAFPYFRTGASTPSVLNGNGIVRTQGARQTSGTVGLARGVSNGGVQLNPTQILTRYAYGLRNRPCRFAPCSQTFGLFYPYDYNSYDSSAILMRLDELQGARSGMEARWQILEDEARSAGAQPGWLRP